MAGIKSFLIGSCALGAAACLMAAPASARPQTGTFNRITFEHTDGRVGYHMHANVVVFDNDTPNGDAAACAPGATDTTVVGDLPPGLTLMANDLPGNGGLHGIDGTPGQPGDWTVRVVIAHVECAQGPDTADYGPKTVIVNFHIVP